MRTIRLLATTFALLAAFCCSGFGDIVTLKSGEKVDGKITSETDKEITMDVKVSAGIVDTRVIQKAEIASVAKEQPDLTAWQALRNLKPGPNSLPATSYDAPIQALRAFVTQHSNSAHAADAQKMLTAFEEEKKRVEAGEAKLSEKWLSKEEAEKERYQINGLIAFNYMKEQSARGDIIGALNSFDVLERQYPGARVYPDAVDFAKRLLTALKAEVDRRSRALPLEKAERERGLQLASGPQRAELEAAIAREEAGAEAAFRAAETQGLKWTPFIPRNERSVTTLANRIPTELQRLAQIDVATLRQSVALTEKARESFQKKEYPAADEAVLKATQLWPANELATRLQAELVSAKASVPEPTTDPANDPSAPAATTETTPEQASADAAATEAPEEPQDDGEKPFLLTPGGAVTVVVAIAFLIAAVSVYRKIRGRANEVLE